MMDLDRRRLIDTRNGPRVQVVSSLCPNPYLNFRSIPPSADNPFIRLLDDFPSCTNHCTSDIPLRHAVSHHIVTESRPVFAPLRSLSPEKLVTAKAEFNKLLAMEIVHPCSSTWASPLHMDHKGKGEWRPCRNYCGLNDITTPDWHPIPHIQDFASNLASKTIFSKFDLVRTYHQIPVTVGNISKTGIITPFGLYEFCRMPFA